MKIVGVWQYEGVWGLDFPFEIEGSIFLLEEIVRLLRKKGYKSCVMDSCSVWVGKEEIACSDNPPFSENEWEKMVRDDIQYILYVLHKNLPKSWCPKVSPGSEIKISPCIKYIPFEGDKDDDYWD